MIPQRSKHIAVNHILEIKVNCNGKCQRNNQRHIDSDTAFKISESKHNHFHRKSPPIALCTSIIRL